MKTLVNAWYKKSPYLYPLAPLAWAYQLGAYTKRWLYNTGVKKQIRFPIPVIVIGNITVGGTGKTPLVIALAHYLSSQGFKPGIVSRGYGGKPSFLPLHVTPDTNPLEAGDETVLIAQKTQCPVVVSPKRVEAVKALNDTYDCDVVLSDDGLQHYQMHRDIEVAVIDGERRFGNKFCLPAGPLREPVRRLKSVDFIVSQGKAEQGEYAMQLVAEDIYSLKDPTQALNLKEALKTPIHAVAGIGNPDRFFIQLRKMGFDVTPHPFPDHHIYTPSDIQFNDAHMVMMTEKDAVKCQPFATSQHWCLPVKGQCDEKFFKHLVEKLVDVVLHLAMD